MYTTIGKFQPSTFEQSSQDEKLKKVKELLNKAKIFKEVELIVRQVTVVPSFQSREYTKWI